MKWIVFPVLVCFLFSTSSLQAQDSTGKQPGPSSISHTDSVYLVKMNTGGNIMITAGVGLVAAGTYLLYQGIKTYNLPPTPANPTEDENRNHSQGTAYAAAGGIAIAGGIILGALGIKKKLDYKLLSKHYTLQTGMLDNGNLGLALNF